MSKHKAIFFVWKFKFGVPKNIALNQIYGYNI